VLATPTGGVPDLSNGGGVSITYKTGPYNHTTLVNVHSTRTVINWQSLDTKGGAVDVRETLAFSQETLSGTLTNSAVLNRISGPATQFNGDLSAPGMRIFMVNPAGIVFGEGSTVNVMQLVASGLDMSPEAFNHYLDDPINNKMEFAGGNGEVISHTDIMADSVFLIGKKVYNIGPIQAPNGLVVMAAGEEVRLFENGSDVSVVVSDFGDGNPDILNSGNITANNGKIVLAAGDTFSRAVRNVSDIAASGGEVSMQAAQIENNGLINVSSSEGNGGSVSLTGTESLTIGTAGTIEANAGENGDGGSVTIQTDGLFRLDGDVSITATGGSVSGKGGSVTISSSDFEILGDISASPGNKTEEPGTLEISAVSNVSIADGPNLGVTNTLYEEDIETLSQEATNIIVNSQAGITVKGISDNEITGQFGNIELHATGEDSAVTFADNTDTIRTTLGDIIIEAGSGGINVGNLTTGKDLSDETPTPGQILLTTNNEGDIITGDLTIRTGWGMAKIDAKSSGNLTVDGDVIVGSESDIRNIPNLENAHAAVYLSAADNIELNGNVGAYAHGVDDDTTEGDITTAEIRILAGTDQDLTGDVFINGNITADAQSSSEGTSEAIIEVDAWGNIVFDEGAVAHAIANGGPPTGAEAGPGTVSEEDPDPEDPDPGNAHAQIIINAQEYPTPPLIGIPDEFSTPKDNVLPMDVLANDTQDKKPVEGGTINSYTEPTAGSLTEIKQGDIIVSLEYNPPEDLSTLTFDENGEATVTFTYVGKVVIEGEELLSDETAVTITLTNNLPVAIKDSAKTFKDQAININVLTNDTDLDLGDVLRAIEGTVAPKNGTLVLNKNGTFNYTPNEGFLGDDSFTYSVTDGANTSAEVEVKITVSEPPPVPLPYISPVPGLDRIGKMEVEISGCPALTKWVAEELGVDEKIIDIWMADSLAPTKGIHPYDTYSRLRKAALILQDANGSYIAALAQVINDLASSYAPPTEEQMAEIADAIKRNTDEDSYYAVADEYLDALVTYVGILSTEMGFSTMQSVRIVADKYISRLNQDQNVGVAAFLTACLSALRG